MAYTYDDFVSAANRAGVLNEFSSYDLDIAKQHPEFGISLVTLKQDVHNATTPQAKALAHETAEQLRQKYGNYSGGATGSQYVSLVPAYKNQYADRIQAAMDKVGSMGAFSYNKDEDPNYAAYRKEYLREGKRASADALGQAAAMTGGVPSSYAVTAASQAGDYYASQLADKVPELYQAAYARYADEYSRALQELSTLQAQEQSDYNRYLTQLDLANQERDYAAAQNAEKRSLAQGQADAILAAGGMPSASMLADAGYTSEYANAMRQAYAASAASSSGSGTRKKVIDDPKSPVLDYTGLFRAAQNSGYPQSFIQNNFENFGFSSPTGLYKEYEAWAETEPRMYDSTDALSAREYNDLIAQVSKYLSQGNTDAALNIVTQYNSQLSDGQYKTLAAMIEGA